MKQLILMSTVMLTSFQLLQKAFAAKIDRSSFYAAMRSKDIKVVDDQLAQLARDATPGRSAFEGALMMKKADLVTGPFKKLQLFKKGRSLLEDALKKHAADPELRFLRLMIQEHAPGIVNYKSHLEEDRSLIEADFNKLPKDLQQIILDYSKESKVLAPEDLKD